MEKLLSIVIPAYNSEKYIENALNSLLKRGERELVEILVIDDGSEDQTGTIADAYERKYPEIVRVLHKKNGGHGSAVNVGITKATGKYFRVLDSDDTVEPKAMEAFLKCLKSLDCDLVLTPFIRVRKTHSYQEPIAGVGQLPIGKVIPFDYKVNHLSAKMHEWTIRTELLQKRKIRLMEHAYYVDMQYVIYPIPWVSTMCILPMPVYRYRLGEEGQSVSVKNMQKNRWQHLRVLKSLLSFYKKRSLAGDKKEVLDYIARGIARMEANQVQISLSLPIGTAAKKELISVERLIRKECPAAYFANSRMSIRLLRKSRYALYPAAAAAWRIIRLKEKYNFPHFGLLPPGKNSGGKGVHIKMKK